MSSASLMKYLQKLDDELLKGAKAKGEGGRKKALPAIEAYRAATGNKKASTLTYAPRPITTALLKLGAELDQSIIDEYSKLVTSLNKSMRAAFYDLYMKRPQDVTFMEMGDVVSVSIIQRGKRNNYAALRKTYTKIINRFYKSFLTLIERPEGVSRLSGDGKTQRITRTGGQAYGQTHEGGNSNVKHQINDAVFSAMQAVNADSVKATAQVSKELEELGREDAGIILSIIKSGKLGEVNLGITSALINSQTGGGIEEQGLKDKLNKAIESLKIYLAETPGSDSLVGAHRKKIIKELIKPFKNKKGIKVKHEDFKIKENTGKTELKKPGGKLSVAAGVLGKIASKKRLKRTAERKTKAPKMALKNILGLINQRLPEQVAGNMGSPKLENRTGTFAQSVRAISVTETAKGFKSVGYTYAKLPYSVYESTSGSRFGSVDRDPRNLIDISIREIVAQFGLGRLYTRRL